MKNRTLLLISQFFLIIGYSQSPADRIDSCLKSWYPSNEPGAVIGIIQHKVIIFEKGYGLTDLVSKNPITPAENFNIGSLTKQFTAFALLRLYYRGKFAMADSIGKYLKLPTPLSSIRIGQLLNHASGIPDHYQYTDTNKIKHATDQDVLAAIQKADSLYFPSGTHYRYSNTAYCILGMLIEKLSRLSYPEYLKLQIFEPLEIKNASVFQINKQIPWRVIGYDATRDGKFIKSDADESVFFSTEADGGIYISMGDYLKWCSALEFGKFSTSQEIRKAWQGQTRVDTPRGLWYGYGWFISDPEKGNSPKTIYHTGSNGGFRSVVFMVPSMDYCISIFSNRSDKDLEVLVAIINKILSISDNSFIKSAPLESFIHSWPKFAPCKETSSFSTLFRKNLNAKGMALN